MNKEQEKEFKIFWDKIGEGKQGFTFEVVSRLLSKFLKQDRDRFTKGLEKIAGGNIKSNIKGYGESFKNGWNTAKTEVRQRISNLLKELKE